MRSKPAQCQGFGTSPRGFTPRFHLPGQPILGLPHPQTVEKGDGIKQIPLPSDFFPALKSSPALESCLPVLEKKRKSTCWCSVRNVRMNPEIPKKETTSWMVSQGHSISRFSASLAIGRPDARAGGWPETVPRRQAAGPRGSGCLRGAAVHPRCLGPLGLAKLAVVI